MNVNIELLLLIISSVISHVNLAVVITLRMFFLLHTMQSISQSCGFPLRKLL